MEGFFRCRWISLLLASGLAGCAVGPDYRPPELAPPESFAVPSAPTRQGAAPIDLARWWRALGDPQLDRLVDQAIVANPDLAIALARLQQAQAAETILIGALLPTVDADAAAGNGTGSDVTRGRVPSLLTSADNTAKTRQIRQIGGFDAVWELDLVGQTRRAIEAGVDDAEAAAEARNAVLVAVIADVVSSYVDLRGLQDRLAVLRQDIGVAQESRDFVKLRFERGLTNELDLTLAQRELSTLKSGQAPLAAEIDAARFTIATLLGRFPEQLAFDLDQPKPIPALPPAIAPGLPLDLIKRRPDVREQERQLAAATARIGVAIGNLFPHIAMSGAIGAQFPAIGSQSASHIWSLGPSAYWPLLDFGALDALVEIADLETSTQLAKYRRTVLRAVREVDSGVAAFAAQQQRVAHLEDALGQGQRAVDLARQRYDRGLTDFLNVVDAERQLYALEDELIAAQQAAGDDFALVFKSLGGGWEHYQDVPAGRLPHPALLAMFERLADPPHGSEPPK